MNRRDVRKTLSGPAAPVIAITALLWLACCFQDGQLSSVLGALAAIVAAPGLVLLALSHLRSAERPDRDRAPERENEETRR